MVDMGFVANKDIDKIIHTKSEAKKRYILANENKPAVITPTAPNLPKTPANDELIKKLMTAKGMSIRARRLEMVIQKILLLVSLFNISSCLRVFQLPWPN